MSQKKMEAYKNAKKNKKELEKKAKKKRIISWICGIVIALLIVADVAIWFTILMLYYQRSSPSKAQLQKIQQKILQTIS